MTGSAGGEAWLEPTADSAGKGRVVVGLVGEAQWVRWTAGSEDVAI